MKNRAQLREAMALLQWYSQNVAEAEGVHDLLEGSFGALAYALGLPEDPLTPMLADIRQMRQMVSLVKGPGQGIGG